MFHILVVEDDPALRELFCAVLSNYGYQPLEAANGLEALDVLDHNYVDLMISDIMMPEMDGCELTRFLRRRNDPIPILMITAKDQLADKRAAFLSGTDDYMVKPVDVNEMIWRVGALLRRARSISERTLCCGSTSLDCDSLTVNQGGQSVTLPQKEFFLLYKLLFSMGKIFTRHQILTEIWGPDFDGDSHTLDVHISRLRDKFKANPDFEIVTVRGLGYKAVKKP